MIIKIITRWKLKQWCILCPCKDYSFTTYAHIVAVSPTQNITKYHTMLVKTVFCMPVTSYLLKKKYANYIVIQNLIML